MNSSKDRHHSYHPQHSHINSSQHFRFGFEPTRNLSESRDMADRQRRNQDPKDAIRHVPKYQAGAHCSMGAIDSSMMQMDNEIQNSGTLHQQHIPQQTDINYEASRYQGFPAGAAGFYSQPHPREDSTAYRHGQSEQAYPVFTFAAASNDYPNYITTIAYIENQPLAMSPEDLLKGLSKLSGTLFPSMLSQQQQQTQLPPLQSSQNAMFGHPPLQGQAGYYDANQVPDMVSQFHYGAPQPNSLQSIDGQGVLGSMGPRNSHNIGGGQPAQNAHMNAYPYQPFMFSPQRQHSSNAHPLMLPPPSPTILSYYSANPNNWLSLASRHMYQPQAYHNEYPSAGSSQYQGHNLPYSLQRPYPSQNQGALQYKRFEEQPSANGTQMLLTQPYQVPGLGAGTLFSSGKGMPLQAPTGLDNQGRADQNIADGQMTAAAAALAVAAAGTNMPHQTQSGYPGMGQQGGHDPANDPLRRSLSMSNLMLLQQQQESLNLQPNNSVLSTFGKPFNIKPIDQSRNKYLHESSGPIFHVTTAPSDRLALNTYSSMLGTNQQAADISTNSHSQLFSEKNKPMNSGLPHQYPPSAPPSRLHNSSSQFNAGPSSYYQTKKHGSNVYGSEHSYQQPYSTPSVYTNGTGAESESYVPGTKISLYQAQSDVMRDQLLQYGHQLYSSDPRSPVLLKLLTTLHKLHSQHLPTILLLACVYFSLNQPEQSLHYNQLILKQDPQYVEAMSNIGTTLRSMGKSREAEEWWWKAVQLRPGYWDAVENLLGVLCNSQDSSKYSQKSGDKKARPRYSEALQLCDFVESSLQVRSDGGISTATSRYVVSEKQLHRLMSLMYTRGNIKYSLGKVEEARKDYEMAIEVVMGGYLINDLIVQIASIGMYDDINRYFHNQQPRTQSPKTNMSIDSLSITLLSPNRALQLLRNLFPHTGGLFPGILQLYKDYGPIVHGTGDNSGGGSAKDNNPLQQTNQVLSTLMLALAKVHQEHPIVNQPLSIVLPLYYFSLTVLPSPSTCNNLGIILSAIPSPPTPTSVPSVSGGSQTAQAPIGSALAMQYYTYGLTLDSKHPHLYTNLGSLLKDLGYIPEAIFMYEKAVKFNSTFDVALANLGNAVKDMGRVQDSIQWYLRAVESNPNFVEAACGLANALAGVCDWRGRDGIYGEMATKWQAIVAPDSDESRKIFRIISMAKSKYSTRRKSDQTNSHHRQRIDEGILDKSRGWMDRIREIVIQQLAEGREYMRHLFLVSSKTAQAQTGQPLSADTPSHLPSKVLVQFLTDLDQLLSSSESHAQPLPYKTSASQYIRNALEICNIVVRAFHAPENSPEKYLSPAVRRRWRAFASQMRSEGGWAIRLLEQSIAVIQRKWYYEAHVYNDPMSFNFLTAFSSGNLNNINSGSLQMMTRRYRRPTLPSGMASPPVPTVLPFHTFTYPLYAREIRLISHRNALRISHSTLGGGAPWLPQHVYPPPPPPNPYVHIGYVSSDFNNHPLSHLMQSVFGMHDRRKFKVFCYATTPPDGSAHRAQVERESDVFLDVSSWTNQNIVERIVRDGIHILINLNGYTKGARNEIFAVRPAPVLAAFMGFAGTLGANWCDYVVTDPIVCPPWTVQNEVRAERIRGVQLGTQYAKQNDGPNGSTNSNKSRYNTIGSTLSEKRSDYNVLHSETEKVEMKQIKTHGYGLHNIEDVIVLDDESENEKEEASNFSLSNTLARDTFSPDIANNGSSDRSHSNMGQRYSQKDQSGPKLGVDGSISDWKYKTPWDFGELDPEEADNSWVYTEKMIYMPHTYFVNDHRQGFREENDTNPVPIVPVPIPQPPPQINIPLHMQARYITSPRPGDLDPQWLAEQDMRWSMRRETFPWLSDNAFIFANFNQLYKIDPFLFKMWLKILAGAPNAILWLLRFPASGEPHLKRAAEEWAGPEVASRVVFTDVAHKQLHIKRGRVADAFLDTSECNAHTTAVDILWSGTPILTWPRHNHKLCSRVAASIVSATDLYSDMIVNSDQSYIDMAIKWATDAQWELIQLSREHGLASIIENLSPQGASNSQKVTHRLGRGIVMDLRKKLFLERDVSRLYDTKRWTRNLEKGYLEAWRRWVSGEDQSEIPDYTEFGKDTSTFSDKGDDDGPRAQKTSKSHMPSPNIDIPEYLSRIDNDINSCIRSKMDVYAPKGQSIWVLDDDDGMPSQANLHKIINS
ncbi:hypothetical protein H4219_000051 [Mycoemilia scoparia]|uniref:protein O-GlcNAc transferase n=1 Tax=Mycoemilia scoparia TaxID=417184 RepID=A0A9W8A4D0_9FUNG|nr:hypothetical protein H4219_000051 [Mycoemilia scoparia]